MAGRKGKIERFFDWKKKKGSDPSFHLDHCPFTKHMDFLVVLCYIINMQTINLVAVSPETNDVYYGLMNDWRNEKQ